MTTSTAEPLQTENYTDPAAVILAAGEALHDIVFTAKRAAADTIATRYGGADWTSDAGTLTIAETGAVVVDTGDPDLAAYLSEYGPSSVRRAVTSKRRNVTRMMDAVPAGVPSDIEAASGPFLSLVGEYAHRTGSDVEKVTAAVTALAHPALPDGNAPVNDSRGHATYNGFRVAGEPDDGGPNYLTRDNWNELTADEKASWDNAATWALHHGLGGADVETIISQLTGYRDMLAALESGGTLDVGLPISRTSATSYSAAVQETLDALDRRLK